MREPGELDGDQQRRLMDFCEQESPLYREAKAMRLPGLMTAIQLRLLTDFYNFEDRQADEASAVAGDYVI